MINRLQISQALSSVLQTVPGVVTFSRRFRAHNDVSPAETPAIFQSNVGEEVVHKSDLGAQLVTIDYDVVVYVNVGGDPNTVPDDILDPVVDAICAALAPKPGTPKNTLGLYPMVQHAWIQGKLARSGGTLGPYALAVIPVKVLAVG